MNSYKNGGAGGAGGAGGVGKGMELCKTHYRHSQPRGVVRMYVAS